MEGAEVVEGARADVASRQPISALVKAIRTSAPLEPLASPAARAAAIAGEVA